MSRGLDEAGVTSYSLVTEDRSVAVVPYCFIEAGSRLRLVSRDFSKGRFVEGDSRGILNDYLRLLVRVNRVSRVYVSRGIGDFELAAALSGLRYLHGRELVPIPVQSV